MQTLGARSWVRKLSLAVLAFALSNGMISSAWAYDFTESVVNGKNLALGQIDCVTLNQISLKATKPEEAFVQTVVHSEWYGFKKDYVLGSTQIEAHNGTNWIRLELQNSEKPEVSEYNIYLYDVGTNPESGAELTGFLGHLLTSEKENPETQEVENTPIGFVPYLAISCRLQFSPSRLTR